MPVETRLQLVLAVLAHEMTVAEAARRHGVSAESINRWRNRFVDAGKAAMEDGMPGKAGSRGSQVERRQRAEIQELKLALAEATVQLRIWQKGSEYVGPGPERQPSCRSRGSPPWPAFRSAPTTAVWPRSEGATRR